MLFHAGKRRYWKSPSSLTDLPTLCPHPPTFSPGWPAAGVTCGPLSQQQSCHSKQRSLLCKVQSHVCCSNSSRDPHCALEISSSYPTATELTWALKTSFSPTNYITVRVRGDIDFRCMEKHCGLQCNLSDLAELIQSLLKCQATVILTRLLLNWNYSTNVFCNCNSANWLFIILGLTAAFSTGRILLLYSFASEHQPCKQGYIVYQNIHKKMLEEQIQNPCFSISSKSSVTTDFV